MVKKFNSNILKKLDSFSWLYQEYIILNKTGTDIAKDLAVGKTTVKRYLKKHKIQKDIKRRIENCQKTVQKKYGVSNVAKLPWVKEKQTQTCLKKFQSKSPLENEEIKNKIKKTNLKRYGVSNPIYSEEIKNKIKKTNLERYHVEYPLESKKIQKKTQNSFIKKYGAIGAFSSEQLSAKIKKTMIKRYGCEYPLQSDILKEKFKETNMNRFGYDHPTKSNLIKEKTKQTNLKKYGVENPQHFSPFKEASKKTCLKKYGVNYVFQSEEVKDKIRKTFLKRYGVEYPRQSKEIQDKIIQTSLKRYGVKYPAQSKEIQDKIHQTKLDNGTYGTSKIEDDLYFLIWSLLEQLLEKDIERQYNEDPRYPFACDFYIAKNDCFIELQGYWSHGKEPYTPDKEFLDNWKKKAEISEHYKNALKVYTESDPLKRIYASQYCLNYLEIWMSDIELGPDWLTFLLLKQGLPLSYSERTLQKEYKRITKLPGDFSKNPYQNKIIEHFQPHFYRKERELWNNPIIRERLVANREKYKVKDKFKISIKQYLQGFKISGIHIGYSFFSPFWIKAFIEKYNIKSIYDPCMGWGHRLLGAKNITYIGNDICLETYQGNKAIAEYFKMQNKYFYNNPAEDFIPKEYFDAVFTCPPYFDTELYDGDETSTLKYPTYKSWLNVWWRKIICNCLKKNPHYFSFVVNNRYKEDMKSICIQEKLIFLEEIPVGHNSLNHFQRTRKTFTKGENLLIFKLK